MAGLILVASGWQVTAFARDTGLAACVAAGGDCRALGEAFTSRYGSPLEPVSLFGALLPMALGLLFGGPLLARELEQGPHRLAWTQSVTRSHSRLRPCSSPGLVAHSSTRPVIRS